MKSHEVMRSTISELGAKSVASDMSLSPSLIYKWCEAKGGGAAGAATRATGFSSCARSRAIPDWSFGYASRWTPSTSRARLRPPKDQGFEARHIRGEREDLKRTAERFVLACESGQA
jgi:hypothetical protein